MTLPDLTCKFCGYKGSDVTSRVVEINPTRNVTVYATDAPVPERWRVAPICLDREACEDRVFTRREPG